MELRSSPKRYTRSMTMPVEEWGYAAEDVRRVAGAEGARIAGRIEAAVMGMRSGSVMTLGFDEADYAVVYNAIRA